MSMTLEEAIKHAEEVSNKCQNFVTAHKEDRELEFIQRTEKCAEEHRQLAEWLKELKERRKLPEIIYCGECKLKIECCRNIRSGGRKDDDFCSCGRRSGKENRWLIQKE